MASWKSPCIPSSHLLSFNVPLPMPLENRSASELILDSHAHNSPTAKSSRPSFDSVEIWNFLNFTDDSHPIHLHMVRFQILDRRNFEPEYYYKQGKVQYNGPVVPPLPNELGWKDTVQVHPGTVTLIITKF